MSSTSIAPFPGIDAAEQTVRGQYFDTSDLALLEHGITLLCTDDAAGVSWRLTLPDGECVEAASTTGRAVPRELQAIVAGVRAGGRLASVAEFDTAETATAAVRALAAAVPQPARQAPRRKPRVLADPVVDYLRAQYAALVAGDLALRRGQDPVHAARVTTRRYRTALRVFADLFEPDRAGALDAELRWYAGLLGRIRDLEVLGERIDHAVHALPRRLVVGPVARQIGAQLHDEQLAARRRLLQAMRGRRYLALMAELRAWQHDPPLTSAGQRRAARVESYLDRAGRELSKRVRQADRPDADEARLHRARMAAKRARYTAELVTPLLGKPARRVCARASAVQQTLGEYQDSVLAAAAMRRMAAAAERRPGESGFTYGVLYALEKQHAAAARTELRVYTAKALEMVRAERGG